MWGLRKDGEKDEGRGVSWCGVGVFKMLFMKFVNSSVWTLSGLSGG